MKKQLSTDRIWLIDEIRGLFILSMVLYHALYDLTMIYQVNIPFFYSRGATIWQLSIGFVFVTISGISCYFSHSNLRRGTCCFAIAMGLTAFTHFFIRDLIIRFGILHLLGLSILLFAMLQKPLSKVPIAAGLTVSAILTILTWQIPRGIFGIPGLWELAIPDQLYQLGFLFPFGFPSQTFYSTDYYPLFPWFFLFLFGSYIGKLIRSRPLPTFFYEKAIPPLCFIGRNTLAIYLVHQPVLFGVFYLIFR